MAVGAGTDDAAVARFLHGLLEIIEQVVQVVFGPGLLDLVERLVDVVEVAAHLAVLVVELLAGFFQRFRHGRRPYVRALIQRVTEASVTIDGEVVGEIGAGLCVLVGVTHDDSPESSAKLAAKVANLRVFDDDDGVMNRSLLETGGAALVISQFTLYGDTVRGRRPSWVAAARPEHAAPLVDAFATELQRLGVSVATGRFGADMQVALVNDGPVTLMLEG